MSVSPVKASTASCLRSGFSQIWPSTTSQESSITTQPLASPIRYTHVNGTQSWFETRCDHLGVDSPGRMLKTARIARTRYASFSNAIAIAGTLAQPLERIAHRTVQCYAVL